ncbi:MAG: hypothetical protein LBR21_06555 [Propionibacteriaceae bacterium]|jgi:hypothetical protein|nr:hypothetical protein [Propionibacteriaceae bacterium]
MDELEQIAQLRENLTAARAAFAAPNGKEIESRAHRAKRVRRIRQGTGTLIAAALAWVLAVPLFPSIKGLTESAVVAITRSEEDVTHEVSLEPGQFRHEVKVVTGVGRSGPTVLMTINSWTDINGMVVRSYESDGSCVPADWCSSPRPILFTTYPSGDLAGVVIEEGLYVETELKSVEVVETVPEDVTEWLLDEVKLGSSGFEYVKGLARVTATTYSDGSAEKSVAGKLKWCGGEYGEAEPTVEDSVWVNKFSWEEGSWQFEKLEWELEP